MPTDARYGILEKEEYLSGARLMYTPVILALQNREEHEFDVSKVNFKEINVDNDSIVAEILTKEATEKAHIKARGMSKSFNIFVKGAKFIKSLADGAVDLQKVHNNALHGDGGNNGLLSSSDPFYITNTSHTVPAASGNGFNRVQDLNGLMVELKAQVGEKTSSSDVKIFVYGSDLLKFLGSITADNETTVREILQRAYPEAMFIEVPTIATAAADGNGFIVVSDDMTTLHTTTVPTISRQGVNEEDEYYYAQYITGSVQVTPDIDGAIIKQAVTFTP